MNKKYFKYFIVIGLALGLFSSSFAQGPGDNTSGMLRAELERTDQLIEYAREAVRVSNAVRAEVELESAIQLQDEAWEEFRTGTTAGLRNAGIWTRQAREQAKSALSSARYTQQNQDAVLRKLERANELLQRASEQLSPRQPSQAMRTLYESAESNLKNAWEFYRNGEYRPALKLASQVENAIRRIVSVSNRESYGMAGSERYSDNVSEFIESTRNQIADCNSETAIQLMEEARQLLELARDRASQDDQQSAMEALKTAKKLATRARLECSGFDGTLSERYERIRNEADELSEMIAADDDEARQLLNQAYDQLDMAAEYIGEGQTQQAAASLRAAQLSLDQVRSLIDASTE
ncbi:MAG: hypothetical protein JSU74_13565 [Candidatus Zixiibacteriota bacterium]|nr:MAG: hypothetical protein JSU74_13565 [candidate division Zixibacteria bacterium]